VPPSPLQWSLPTSARRPLISRLLTVYGVRLIGRRELAAHGPPTRCRDGSLLFRGGLCDRSAPSTPSGVLGCCDSKVFAPSMAFAREVRARLPLVAANAGFNLTTRQSDSSTYGPITRSPPKAASSWRFDQSDSPSAVDQPAFAACRLTYAGEVPGCSRIQSLDCCFAQLCRRLFSHS